MIPDRWLERYRVGALDPARRGQVDAARSTDPGVDQRLQALDASDREILARYPRLPGPAVEGPGGRWPLVLAVAAVAVGLVLVLPGRDTERIKGLEPELLVFREGQRAPLREGDRVHPGDVLQLAVVRGDAGHGVILSIDGRGGVTVHADPLPDAPASGAVPLDDALELDDAPAFERFFLVTCPVGVTLDRLVDTARAFARDPATARTEPLPIPAGCRQTSRLLIKDGS